MSHISVLLNETIDALLAGRTEGIYIDATFGRGGHTQALLKRLSANSRVIAFDKDPQAQAVGAAMVGQDSRLTMVHASFADLAEQLEQLNTGLVDGVMADLGVSSPQLDQAGRGFSFMQDGPLDMRMDNSKGLTASQWLQDIEEEDLANVLFQYGEERYSRRIARAVKQAGLIETTGQLAQIVKEAHPKWEKHKHPATRSFQAIRIAINHELDDLTHFLPQAVQALKPQGRLAVISFHSLEDRLVKQFIQQQSTLPEQQGWLPQSEADPRTLKKVARIAPSPEEVSENPRARSAWLRVAERLEHA
ncbi:16S rRNA (cytosine(1402)-N(4))-methyltransferase [Alkanindiges hydrocarboniclasticus]|uniref:Ribosomal RNA small subunit methyltransferase H n=1 Tax=Alkanindiges hydrocarboniclasticus TaxID=1907941 RepID=A0A1S8CSY7_9GAMM|nr:16S rRNA (cytosine(1402)-N(4))-methyltransferase RsmH [Alkanindiges hydrocarboniclasticus]ONG38749.1 16S rRNA (cytosine(1402)-N(4))-methyltransferase [Alkanindiges hydrocarboniclasticus]